MEYFHLPIYYLTQKYKINDKIIEDLELNQNKDASGTSLYEDVLNPTTCFSKETATLWSEYYTDDIAFLKDSQMLFKIYKPPSTSAIYSKDNFQIIKDTWEEIKQDTGFLDKYHYIDTKWFKHFNNNLKFNPALPSPLRSSV